MPKDSKVRDSKRTVIGIDPGLRATGFAVLELGGNSLDDIRLIDCGEIKPSTRMAMEKRLGKIFEELEAVMSKWQPRMMVVEKVYSEALYPNTAIVMGHVRGIICLAAYRAESELVEIAPTVAKKALTGYGRASKQQIGSAIARLLRLKELPESEHQADALTLATVGALRYSADKDKSTPRRK